MNYRPTIASLRPGIFKGNVIGNLVILQRYFFLLIAENATFLSASLGIWTVGLYIGKWTLETKNTSKRLYIIGEFLPRDTMHKCGLCFRAVSGWLAGCLSRSCILSKRLRFGHSCYRTWIGTVPKLSNGTHFQLDCSHRAQTSAKVV